MELRSLGMTGMMTSPIGFGAFKIGRNTGTKYARGYELPTDDDVETLLNGVLDLGINLIDTAPAYGSSEERIGRAIAHRRDEFVLSTKVGEEFSEGVSRYDFSTPVVTASIERSLSRLRTDVLDIVLVHSNGRDLEILDSTDVVSTLVAARARGIARAIGFSGKTPEGAIRALEWADVIMVEYHLEDQSHEAAIVKASESGAAVLVKKGLGSGRLDPGEAIPFVMSNDAVSSMVIGGLNLEHVRANCAIVESVS